MRLIFDYPTDFDSLEIMLATKAYETIWQQDGERIVQSMEQHTGLHFKQDEIHVTVHDGQSMSGMDGVPMRLNVRNASLNEKRNALVHELAHRLLFGNGLYAPDGEGPDADEIRVFLFQGDVLEQVYGREVYDFWADVSTDTHSPDHGRLVSPILALTSLERHQKINQFVKAGTP